MSSHPHLENRNPRQAIHAGMSGMVEIVFGGLMGIGLIVWAGFLIAQSGFDWSPFFLAMIGTATVIRSLFFIAKSIRGIPMLELREDGIMIGGTLLPWDSIRSARATRVQSMDSVTIQLRKVIGGTDRHTISANELEIDGAVLVAMINEQLSNA